MEASRHRFAARIPRGVVPIIPGPGQESVWDYPRPPAVEPSGARIRIIDRGVVVAETQRAVRVLETAGAPTWYLPPQDVAVTLIPSTTSSVCEWKGRAAYWDMVRSDGTVVRDAAWSYARPNPGYGVIAGRIAFYPQRVDEAWVDDDRVRPQEGGFYGGWVTDRITGPIKGGPGSFGW